MNMKTRMKRKYFYGFQRQLLLDLGALLSAWEKSAFHWGFLAKQEQTLWPCATFTSAYPQLDAFDPPEGFSSTHGKMAMKPLGFQTQNQIIHIYLTHHTPAQANKWMKGWRRMKMVAKLLKFCLVFIGFYSKTITEMLRWSFFKMVM